MSSYPNANQFYAPTPEVLYKAFRTQIDEALAQPFFEKADRATAEVTLFALLVYTVCGSKRYPSETITTLYRLFLQDISGRPDENQPASYYQSLLNQTITKFSETPITGALTPAMQKLSEISAGMMGLSTAQIPFVYGFMQAGLNANYNPAVGATANAFPTQPTSNVAPQPSVSQSAPSTQAYTPSAPTYGATPPPTPPPSSTTPPTYGTPAPQVPPTSTGQGVSGSASYSVSDFSAPQQTPSYTAPPTTPSAPQHTPYGGQGVSGSSTYSVSDFSAPNAPTPPPAQPGTPVPPQSNLQYYATGAPSTPYTATPNNNAPAYNTPPAYQGQGYVPPNQPPYNNGQPQYTSPYNTPQGIAVPNPLNSIGGWLLAMLILHGIGAGLELLTTFGYFSYGATLVGFLNLILPVLSIAFIVCMCLRKKISIPLFFAFRIWGIILSILLGADVFSIVMLVIWLIIWGVYLLKSKRVAAVLGVEKFL